MLKTSGRTKLVTVFVSAFAALALAALAGCGGGGGGGGIPGSPASGGTTGGTGTGGGGGGGGVSVASTIHTALYAATITNPDPVFGFAVDATSGALSALAASPYATAQTPTEVHSVAVAPSGFLFATDTLNHVILEYKIDSSTADLSLLSALPAVPSRDCPNELAVSPSGGFLYVTDSCNQDIFVYSIDTTTGATTPLSGSPFNVTSQFSLTSPALGRLAEDPTGKYLYVVDQNGNVLEITLASGGTMSPIGLAVFNGTDIASPNGVTVDPNGNYVYVTDDINNSVVAFSIDKGTGACHTTQAIGCLNEIGPNIEPSSTASFLTSPQDVVVDSSDKYVYVGNEFGATVAEFAIDQGSGSCHTTQALGCLDAEGQTQGPQGLSNCPNALVIDPTDHFLYASDDCSNRVLEFAINASGNSACVQSSNAYSKNAAGCLSVAGSGSVNAGSSSYVDELAIVHQ